VSAVYETLEPSPALSFVQTATKESAKEKCLYLVDKHIGYRLVSLSNHGCWVYRSTHATYYAVLPVRLSLPLTFTPWSGLCLWVCFFFCFILIIPMWWIPLYFSAYCWMMPPSSTRYSCAIKHFFDDNSFSALYMSIMPHSSFLVFVVETCILRDVFYMRLHVFYFELHFILEFAHFIPHYTVDHTPK